MFSYFCQFRMTRKQIFKLRLAQAGYTFEIGGMVKVTFAPKAGGDIVIFKKLL